MSARADISVAIATRDRPEALARCLASLGAGSRTPAEVVVADQSAGSETRDVVAAAPGARYVDGGRDGLAGAQNAALAHCTRALVAVIDDDCVADREWLAVLERRLGEDGGLALVAGRVLPLAPVGGRRHPVSSRTATRRQAFSGKVSPWHVGSGNNFAVRRAWFERVGGCDLRLGPGRPGQGALDMDLFYRLLRAGGRGLYEPEAVVFHERATREGRLGRRRPYGHGMGAMCTFLLLEGDVFGARLLVAWLGLRGRVLASALARGRRDAIREEALMVSGTVAGMGHALRRRSTRSPEGGSARAT